MTWMLGSYWHNLLATWHINPGGEVRCGVMVGPSRTLPSTSGQGAFPKESIPTSFIPFIFPRATDFGTPLLLNPNMEVCEGA